MRQETDFEKYTLTSLSMSDKDLVQVRLTEQGKGLHLRALETQLSCSTTFGHFDDEFGDAAAYPCAAPVFDVVLSPDGELLTVATTVLSDAEEDPATIASLARCLCLRNLVHTGVTFSTLRSLSSATAIRAAVCTTNWAPQFVFERGDPTYDCLSDCASEPVFFQDMVHRAATLLCLMHSFKLESKNIQTIVHSDEWHSVWLEMVPFQMYTDEHFWTLVGKTIDSLRVEMAQRQQTLTSSANFVITEDLIKSCQSQTVSEPSTEHALLLKALVKSVQANSTPDIKKSLQSILNFPKLETLRLEPMSAAMRSLISVLDSSDENVQNLAQQVSRLPVFKDASNQAITEMIIKRQCIQANAYTLCEKLLKGFSLEAMMLLLPEEIQKSSSNI